MHLFKIKNEIKEFPGGLFNISSKLQEKLDIWFFHVKDRQKIYKKKTSHFYVKKYYKVQ